jgi:hypothetical protein
LTSRGKTPTAACRPLPPAPRSPVRDPGFSTSWAQNLSPCQPRGGTSANDLIPRRAHGREPKILWAAASGGRTISGRGSWFFNGLRRHFRAGVASSLRSRVPSFDSADLRPRHFHRRNQSLQRLGAPFPSRMAPQEKIFIQHHDAYCLPFLHSAGVVNQRPAADRAKKNRTRGFRLALAARPSLREPALRSDRPFAAALPAHCRPFPDVSLRRAEVQGRLRNGLSFQTAGKGRVHPPLRALYVLAMFKSSFSRDRNRGRASGDADRKRRSSGDRLHIRISSDHSSSR